MSKKEIIFDRLEPYEKFHLPQENDFENYTDFKQDQPQTQIPLSLPLSSQQHTTGAMLFPSQNHVDNSTFIPIAILSHRPLLLDCLLSSLLRKGDSERTRKGHLKREMITVFKNSPDLELDSVAQKHHVNSITAPSIYHIGSSIQEEERNQLLAQLNLWIFTEQFDRHPQSNNVILLEDDLVVSFDFIDFFEQLCPLMQRDESIFCVSAWYDNGYPGLVSDSRRVIRQEHFGGLGWAINRKHFYQLQPLWKSFFEIPTIIPWDLFVQNNFGQKVCLVPLVPRTHHVSEIQGTHYNSDFQKDFFANMMLADEIQQFFVDIDTETLLQPGYDRSLEQMLNVSQFISCFDQLLHSQDRVLVVYFQNDLWNSMMESFGMIGTGMGEVPRGLTRGLVIVRYANNWVLLVSTSSEMVLALPNVFDGHLPLILKSDFDSCKTLPTTSSPSPNMYVILSEAGESCVEACSSKGKTCQVQLFPYLNSCDNQWLNCEEGQCNTTVEFFHPSISKSNHTCFRSIPRHFNCYGKHPDFKRLCPCV